MFSSLFDLGFQRNANQAAGFYIVYVVLLALACGVLGGIYGMILSANPSLPLGDLSPSEAGLRTGATLAIIFCFVLSSVIVAKKKQLSITTMLIVLASTGMAVLLGALGGVGPIAYLTMLSDRSHQRSH
ncbi:MAG: hypothetical protein AAFP09_04675 [Cyanobacteria bacterium J06607_10]